MSHHFRKTGILVGLLILASHSSLAHAETAVSPVIGADPASVDFGRVCVCRDVVVDIFNAVQDPANILHVTGLAAAPNPPFSLVNPPAVPFDIPGDGTRVHITVRFCPTAQGVQNGTFTITSSNASNSPFVVGLTGRGNVPPVCNADGPYAGNVGEVIQFDGTGSNDPDGSIVQYQWNFGDGNTGTNATPTHAYATPGDFTVTLTVTDDCERSSTCTSTAHINAPPHCDANGPYAGPVGVPIQFNGTGSNDPGGVIVAYDWNFGDGGTGTGATPTHTYSNPGFYTVTLCVTDNDRTTACCETTADISATPVDLVSFTATTIDGTVHLNWRTGFEIEHAGFRVNRANEGSNEFVKISGDDLVRDLDGDHVYEFEDHGADVGATYLYQLEAVANNGEVQLFTPLQVTVTRTLPAMIALHPSRPNPFNPSTSIGFDLPEAGRVSVRIYDGSGRLVRTLTDAGALPAGTHALTWDGRDDNGAGVSSGVYLIRFQAGGRLFTQKIVLAR